MSKNSFLPPKVLRTNIALFSIVAMLAGFLASRALLSMAMLLFGLNGLLGVHPRQWLRQKWWLLGLVWVLIYIVSRLWSSDMGYWFTRCEVKMPILLLPLASAFTPSFNNRQLVIFTVALSALLFSGVVYTLYFFIGDPASFTTGYIYSHVLPTIPKNDHIRFSLAVAGGIAWNMYFHPFLGRRWLRIANIFLIVIFSLYLHILAARTGLVALYILLGGWTLYLALRRKTRWAGISLILCFSLVSALAFSYIPTLRERVGYLKYTIIVFRQEGWSAEYSDMGRLMSYDIAAKLIREHPLKGVGAGDILDTMKEGYDRWYPQVKEEQRLIPHNQFLTVGVACGVPALLVFIAWVFYPLTQLRRNREGFFFLMVWLMMLVPLMAEPVLEVQFGVFVYLFFLLWQYQAMKDPPRSDPENKQAA